MAEASTPLNSPVELPPAGPPRAFTQGLGVVFQVVGVLLFLTMSFICCGSSLLSKDWAMKSDLTHVGWGTSAEDVRQPAYSAQKALTISVFAGVFFGVALATAGLGMQAESRVAAPGAVIITCLGEVFWLVHAIFAATVTRSAFFTLTAAALACVFAILLLLAINAYREMRTNPPPPGHDLLPAGYKIPYSHYHDDPPEVRLAAELQQRRERLAVQQAELEALEAKLKRKLDEDSQQEKSP
jgi:hypothetical protein